MASRHPDVRHTSLTVFVARLPQTLAHLSSCQTSKESERSTLVSGCGNMSLKDFGSCSSRELLRASRRRDKVHSFYNLQECTGSSGVQLAVLDDVSMPSTMSVTGMATTWALGLQAKCGVVCFLRIAQFGMFWSRIAQQGMFCWRLCLVESPCQSQWNHHQRKNTHKQMYFLRLR